MLPAYHIIKLKQQYCTYPSHFYCFLKPTHVDQFGNISELINHIFIDQGGHLLSP